MTCLLNILALILAWTLPRTKYANVYYTHTQISMALTKNIQCNVLCHVTLVSRRWRYNRTWFDQWTSCICFQSGNIPACVVLTFCTDVPKFTSLGCTFFKSSDCVCVCVCRISQCLVGVSLACMLVRSAR